jgi:hypothetical protein
MGRAGNQSIRWQADPACAQILLRRVSVDFLWPACRKFRRALIEAGACDAAGVFSISGAARKHPLKNRLLRGHIRQS